jgi:hypothetical protein
MIRLIDWLAVNEKQQRKYRFAMIHKLARMEAAISLQRVEQLAQTQSKPPFYFEDKLMEDAKADEEFISNQSEQVGVTMLRYIYGEDRAPEPPEPRRDRRRKWHGWEI